MKKILFVCTGNTCRSPMAEAMLKHMGKGKFEVKSAGVFAVDGQGASEHTQTILQSHAIPINHFSQQVQEELMDWADYVLTMTSHHQEVLRYHFPHLTGKIFVLSSFVEEELKDISDPYGGSAKEYEETFNELRYLLSKMI